MSEFFAPDYYVNKNRKHYRICEATGAKVGYLVIDERGQGYLRLIDGYTSGSLNALYVTEELSIMEEESE